MHRLEPTTAPLPVKLEPGAICSVRPATVMLPVDTVVGDTKAVTGPQRLATRPAPAPGAPAPEGPDGTTVACSGGTVAPIIGGTIVGWTTGGVLTTGTVGSVTVGIPTVGNPTVGSVTVGRPTVGKPMVGSRPGPAVEAARATRSVPRPPNTRIMATATAAGIGSLRRPLRRLNISYPSLHVMCRNSRVGISSFSTRGYAKISYKLTSLLPL